jgi:hypothetical protein
VVVVASNNPTQSDTGTTDDDLEATVYSEHNDIPADTRDHVLNRDRYCQVCGCQAMTTPEAPDLLVQRIAPNPPHCNRDDPANLVARCVPCARWIEQMPSRDDLPRALQTRLDGVDLNPTLVELLNYLWQEGPVTTGAIATNLSSYDGRDDCNSVRSDLYTLMRKDTESGVSGRLVAKDALTDEYGMPEEIPEERDARGRIPLDPMARRTRILEAVVARLSDVLESRVDNRHAVIAEVIDRGEQTVRNMTHRAEAFQFPLTAWAEANKVPYTDSAVIEGVEVVAAATDNVSPRHVADPLAELLERNNEEELARSLREYFFSDLGQSSLPDGQPLQRDTDESPGAEQHRPQEHEAGQPAPAADDQDLHVFDGDNANSDGRPHDEDGYYPTEDDYAR